MLSAGKPSAFRDRFEFDLAGETYQLKPVGWSRRRFVVLGGGEEAGVIKQTGWLTRKSTIDLPDAWALPVRVFIFWLVVLIWARDDADAS